MKTYGYCRISTGKQNIDRQIRNIKDEYPEAMIVEEMCIRDRRWKEGKSG